MAIDKEKYLLHVEEDKIIDMRRILDLIEIVLDKHIVVNTDFLDPYTVDLSRSILNRFDEIQYKIVGGFKDPERQIIIIYNSYVDDVDEALTLTGIRIKLNTSNVEHRDVLGSLLGLGIVREKIGDISIGEGYADIVVISTISDFVLYNLEKIRRENVSVSIVPLDELLEIEEDTFEKNYTISSLRLDAYISEIYNLSRLEGQNTVKSEKVKVNFKLIDKPSYTLEEGDIVSVRGKGRSTLLGLNGTSKKGKTRIVVSFPA